MLTIKNPSDGYNLTRGFELIKGKTFFTNDTLDIGVFKLTIPAKVFDGRDTIKILRFNTIPLSQIRGENQTELGTQINFIGFPLGIGSKGGIFSSGEFGDAKINPLVRTGIVAWKKSKSDRFLLDAISYGGNSGSPIFTQNNFNKPPALIGMVTGHLGDSNRVNFGLANCVWIDEILKVVEKIK